MSAVAAVVVGGLSTVASVVSSQGQKKAASRAANLQEQRLRLEQAQRATDAAREKARLARVARVKRAAMLNAGSQIGASESSALAGGIQSVNSSLAAEQGYVDFRNTLAQESGNISQRQIDLNLSNIRRNANMNIFESVITGIGSMAVNAQEGGLIDFGVD